MPSAHLMINLAAPVRLYDSNPSVPPAVLTGGWFMGVWTRRFVIEHQTPVRVVGVHFKPWGLSAFVDAPSAELRDRCVSIDALWGSSSSALCDRVAGSASTGEMLRMVEAELLARLIVGQPRGFDVAGHAARRLAASWGALPVGVLTDGAGVSRNYVAAQFKSHVGVTPKRVARIYRFARLILSVDATHPVNWSQLATAAGYFDQAHFSKEFKEFTGHSPTDYLRLRRRFPADETFPPDNGPMPDE